MTAGSSIGFGKATNKWLDATTVMSNHEVTITGMECIKFITVHLLRRRHYHRPYVCRSGLLYTTRIYRSSQRVATATILESSCHARGFSLPHRLYNLPRTSCIGNALPFCRPNHQTVSHLQRAFLTAIHTQSRLLEFCWCRQASYDTELQKLLSISILRHITGVSLTLVIC